MWLLLALVGLTSAAPIPPTAATASSSYPPENGVSYGPDHVIDGRVQSCWIEGERGAGLGSSVQLELGEAREVRALRVWNGNQASIDLWQRHNRVKNLELVFSDGTKAPFTLPDSQEPQLLTLPKPVTTTSVKLRFTSVYPGTTFGDTPLAEVQVLDGAPDVHAVPVAVKASSTYATDATASYVAAHVADGLPDTMWCEGDAKGDGAGQWLELDFGAPVALAHLRVWNGNAASDEDNAAANQATGVRLTFDSGATADLTLATGAAAQHLTFDPVTTRKVRVTVTGVAKGTTYDDLCFSELTFGP